MTDLTKTARGALALLVCLLWAAAARGELRGYENGVWQHVSFGSYPQAAGGEAAPIVWKVLRSESGAATLLSLRVLDVLPAHEVPGGYSGWEKSSLRSWLNGAFLSLAFLPQEQTALLGDGDGGLVTLPDAGMMKDAALGFGTDLSRAAGGTDYALSRGLVLYGGKRPHSPYWLSTRAQSNSISQRRVMQGGALGYAPADAAGIGVRPVIALSLQSVQIAGGEGSPERPFELRVTDEALARALLQQREAEERARAEEEARLQREAAEQAERDRKRRGILDALEPARAQLAALEAAGGAGEEIERLRSAVGEYERALQLLDSLSVEGFPPLTREGFLLPGEEPFVFADEAQGRWRYASQTLRIQILRHADEKEKLRWFEAEIFSAPGERFRIYQNDPASRHRMEDMSAIARKHGLVFAMNGDYYIYRVSRGKETGEAVTVGRIIRNGEVYYDQERKRSWSKFPNLDILALWPDGNMQVYYGDEISASALKKAGVENTLAFGPFLIRGGEINEESVSLYGKTKQPRSGIGMVAPGHYFVIIVEARTSKSEGVPVAWLADRFLEKGCATAFNLDGGQTAVLIFMGEQLNEIGEYDGKTNSRVQNEVLGIGRTGN